MQILDALASAPARRDVQSIRGALAEIGVGDDVRMLIRSPRYGLYGIEGVVGRAVGGELVVADVFLGTGTEVQSLALAAAPEASAGERSVEGLQHGDPVRVTFSTPTLGTFAVSGPLTAGQDELLLVGSWIVANGGQVAPRVESIERLELTVHTAHVPAPRAAKAE